jgi:hypothetical protein
MYYLSENRRLTSENYPIAAQKRPWPAHSYDENIYSLKKHIFELNSP